MLMTVFSFLGNLSSSSKNSDSDGWHSLEFQPRESLTEDSMVFKLHRFEFFLTPGRYCLDWEGGGGITVQISSKADVPSEPEKVGITSQMNVGSIF
ncbi:hypothetical protein Tco_0834726 [Tanacetum coccineum]